jgi:2-dehydro-3-deoxyphosphogluconate aldolase / (4S)-4-hydroxy-2-oxoglutarate aldolase
MTTLDEVFGTQRVMAILRGLPPKETVALAGKLWDLGVTVLEVPIGRPEQIAALSAAVRAGAARGRAVGAGTVVSVEQVKAAAAAGATYTVAPGLDVDVLAASHAAGLPHLPGVATATEVQRARAAGSSWVKAFPATALGPAWFAAMRGPFPDVSYVATGGVTAATVRAFLDAGARAAALGAALADPEQVALLGDLL